VKKLKNITYFRVQDFSLTIFSTGNTSPDVSSCPEGMRHTCVGRILGTKKSFAVLLTLGKKLLCHH